MANTFLSIPVPAGNGVGASVDISTLGWIKAFVLAGTLEGCLNVEISDDNVTWAALTTFYASADDIQVPFAANFVRARVTGFIRGASTLSVGSDTSTVTILALPVPAGNGLGATVDVSAMGQRKTIFYSGGRNVDVNCVVEISTDNVVFSQLASFQGATPGYLNIDSSVQTMRIRTNGFVMGTPVMFVASVPDPGGGQPVFPDAVVTAQPQALWLLNQQLSDLTVQQVGNDLIYSGFVNFLNPGTNDLRFFDTLGAVSTDNRFHIGSPGAFNMRRVDFYQGTQTQQRDYLFGAPLLEPQVFTLDMVIVPWVGLGAAQNVIEKVFNPAAWSAPKFVSVQLFITAAVDGTWGITITNAGGSTNLVVGSGNSFEAFRMRFSIYNHLGFTYDGVTLRPYINGIAAPSLAIAGPIDYGSHGDWVIGANENIVPAGLDSPNAGIQIVSITPVVQPLSYFEQAFQALTGLATQSQFL